jgi:hypothetical protein
LWYPSPHILSESRESVQERPLRINLGTRDQFAFGQMNYPSSYTSQHYLSGYPPVVENRFLTTYYGNYEFVYEQPPPAPFLAAPPALTASPPPSPPKYHAIQPRPDEHGSKAEMIDNTLQFKPRKRQRGGMRRKSQRLPQKGSGKSKSTQLEAGANMVPSTTPERDRFELPNHLILPHFRH